MARQTTRVQRQGQVLRLLADGMSLIARQEAQVQGQVSQLLASGIFPATLIVEADEDRCPKVVSLLVERPEMTTSWLMASRAPSCRLVHLHPLAKRWAYRDPCVYSGRADEVELTKV